MTDIRALTVCVGYDDLLRVTLPHTLPHVRELVVVTAPQDEKTRAYAAGFDNVRVFETDAFYRDGAKFNKGLAVEEGFDFLGRRGWILVLDADIVLPADATDRMIPLSPGRLYTPPRRILEDAARWPEFADHKTWDRLPGRKEDRGHYGYFQLFHASDEVLVRRPWYGTAWTHAGRCDDEFQHRWAAASKLRPGFEVLHLGRCDENWFGRASARIDGGGSDPEAAARRALQEKLRRKHGWGRKKTGETFDERVNPQ